MRALLVILVLAGCADESLDDRAYRRLVEPFDSYDQCLADKSQASCYQTFILCGNGRVMMDLDNRPVDGTYAMEGALARARVEGDLIVFDTEKLSSAQLPGRRWELATPSFYGCDVE